MSTQPVDLKAPDALATQLEELKARIKKLEDRGAKLAKQKRKVSIFMFSGNLDHALVAFNIAIAAANIGMDVSMFFTFWGLNIIKDPKKNRPKSGLMMKMMGWMLPNGSSKYVLSRMNMFGMGTWMMKRLMEEKKIISLEERLKIVQEFGVKLYACDNSLIMMGLDLEDLIDYEHLSIAGAAKFTTDSLDNAMTLFF